METVSLTYKYRLIASLFLLLLFFSCQQKDALVFPSSEHILVNEEDKKTVSLPSDFQLGGTSSFSRYSDSIFIFIDMARRGIFYIDQAKDSVYQISRQGKGPAEYGAPVFLKVTNHSISFTDASTTSVKEITLKGEQIKEIYHRFGGGKKFIANGKDIFIQGSYAFLINQISSVEEDTTGYFPISDNYASNSNHFFGGGLTIIDNDLYAMSPIQPVIFVRNLLTEHESSFSPKEWSQLKFNFDGKWFASLNSESIFKTKEKLAIFYDIFPLLIDKKTYLVTCFVYNSTTYFNLINPITKNIDYYFTTQDAYIGNSINEIFLRSNEKEISSIYSFMLNPN